MWSHEDVWSLTVRAKSLIVRGWGHLTGRGGGLGLDEEYAGIIQDAFADYTVHCLNTHSELLKALRDAEQILKSRGEALGLDNEGPVMNKIALAIERASVVNSNDTTNSKGTD